MSVVLLFLALNFLLFLPRYFINAATTSFIPLKEIFENGKFNCGKIFSRFNDDVFRINIEFTLLIILLILFKKPLSLQVAVYLAVFFYLITLLLFYYHYSIYSIYKTYPALTTDLKFIKQGISIAYNGYKIYFFSAIFGFAFFLFLLFQAIHLFVTLLFLKNTNSLMFVCVFVLFFSVLFMLKKKVNLFRFNTEFDFHYSLYSSFQSSIKIINSNLFFNKKNELEIKNIPNLINEAIFEIPKGITLKKTPNIYFIAIESYGAILYENENYKENYKLLTKKITSQLNANNWQIASSLSNSPVSGGGSWMSYTSLLKGMDIKNDSLYRNMIQKRKQFTNESVFTILEKFNYNNFLIAGIGGFENFKIDWEETLDFIGVKNKIVYKDLEYTGERFNFGPSAPDQYFLNKSIQLMKEKYPNQPIACFAETINSHVKFHSPTVVFENWKKCNSATLEEFKPTKNLDKNNKENYFKAIEYQLKTIENLVINEETDSIFVVFGDHQPALITNHTNSFKTPIHIISKNANINESWVKLGFQKGFFIENQSIEMNHSDFKSMFFEILFRENNR